MRAWSVLVLRARYACSARAVCAACAAVCLFCARFARSARSVCAVCAAVCTVCAAVCAACARGPCALRVYFKVSNNSTARFVCASVCLLCARGPCALRAYFKVSNNSTARFVVTVSAPPLSGSASPALSTSSPKGSPPAVRSSFI